MAITLGGLMRGGLPVATQFLQENIPQNAEDRIARLNERYNAIAKDFQTKEKAILAENDQIKTLAKNLGVDPGIAKQAYQLSGGKIDKASKIINNMLSAFPKGIPVSKIEEPKPVKTVDPISVNKLESVDIAPKGAGEESIFQSFKNLFKYYSNDDVVKMFANRSGIPEAQVRKTLSGTFDLPELETKVLATPSAIAAGLTTDKGGDSQGAKLGFFKNHYMTVYNYNEVEASRAANVHVLGNIPLTTLSAQGESINNIVSRDGKIQQMTATRFDDSGAEINPNKEDRELQENKISTGTRSLNNVVLIKDLLAKNNQVFSVLGRLQKVGTNLADIFGQPQIAQFIGGADVTRAIQAARTFIKTTKEAIFDDPRISDRDLQIINQYIGIIMDDSALGVGRTNALAAIIALERAAVTQIATSVAKNSPSMVKNDKIISFLPNGTFNANDTSTIAGQMYGRIMKAYGLNQNDVKKALFAQEDNKATRAQLLMLEKHENVMSLAKNSVNDIIARQSMTAEDFKKNYRNVYLIDISTAGQGA